MVEETSTDSSPSHDSEKPTGSDVANAAASAPESEAPAKQDASNAKPAASDNENKSVDFLEKIVRNAVKKDEKNPDDPSPFLKLFGGLLNTLKNRHDKKDARKNVETILLQTTQKLKGKEITPDKLMSLLKEMKHDPAITELTGAKNIIATLESNPIAAIEMFEDFRTQAQADELAAQTPEKAATTPKADTTPESPATDIKVKDFSPKTPNVASQQRAATPVTGTDFITKEVKTTFSTKGPEAVARKTDLDAEQAPEAASNASGPSSAPSSTG